MNEARIHRLACETRRKRGPLVARVLASLFVLAALSLVLLGLGWVHRDGLALGLSLIAGLLAWGWLAASAHLVWAVLSPAWAWLGGTWGG